MEPVSNEGVVEVRSEVPAGDAESMPEVDHTPVKKPRKTRTPRVEVSGELKMDRRSGSRKVVDPVTGAVSYGFKADGSPRKAPGKPRKSV